MRLEVRHRTRYRYPSAVTESFNELRLRPVSDEQQGCERTLLRVLPPVRLRHYLDLYSNHVSFFEVSEPHTCLEIESVSLVERKAHPASDALPSFRLDRVAECARMERCHDFLQASRYVEATPEAWRLAVDATHGQTDLWQAALAIMHLVFNEFAYCPGATHVQTHVHDVLLDRRGVCQDFAHVMLAMCRSLGIPAAYVSGYIYNGPKEELRGAQATHAWCEVFVPGSGWLGLDPTNDQLAGERYVKVAVGRDYADVAPVRGHYRGAAGPQMDVEVTVELVRD